MKKCPDCNKEYDETKSNQCPNCEVKPMSKEFFKRFCKFLAEE